MGIDNHKPWEHPEIKGASELQYVIGYVLSLALLGLSLVLVQSHAGTTVVLISVISFISIVTVMVQLILLFHLDFSEAQRWNSLTLMMNVPLLILSVGLTSIMFHQLYIHVMQPSMMVH